MSNHHELLHPSAARLRFSEAPDATECSCSGWQQPHATHIQHCKPAQGIPAVTGRKEPRSSSAIDKGIAPASRNPWRKKVRRESEHQMSLVAMRVGIAAANACSERLQQKCAGGCRSESAQRPSGSASPHAAQRAGHGLRTVKTDRCELLSTTTRVYEWRGCTRTLLSECVRDRHSNRGQGIPAV